MRFSAIATAMVMAGAVTAASGAQAQGARVGGGPDAHGCYADGGYTYSALRRSCLRLWEAGVRLDPVTPQGTAVLSAFVVFASDDDHRKAELYLPGVAAPQLLKAVRDHGVGPLTGHGYTLTLDRGLYRLADRQDQVIFQGPPSVDHAQTP